MLFHHPLPYGVKVEQTKDKDRSGLPEDDVERRPELVGDAREELRLGGEGALYHDDGRMMGGGRVWVG